MDSENIHKGNESVVVKLKEYFFKALKKPSVFISIFIIFELLPVYSLKFKDTNKLTEDKNSIVNVLYEEDGEELIPVVKEQKLSIIGSTEKYMLFYDHSNHSKKIIPKNKIIEIKSEQKVI